MPPATVKMIGDPEAMRAFLRPHLQRAYPGLGAIKRVDLRTLGSVQAGRGVVRMAVRVKSGGPKRKTFVLFGNYDTRGGSKYIYRVLVYLQRHGFGVGRYGVPIPLLYSNKYKLLVYRSFPGKRVRDDLEANKLTARELYQVMRQSAEWLKKFHRLPPTIGGPRNLRLSPDFFSQLTKEHRRAIAAALPFVNKELGRRGQRALVHGDPHLANCIRGINKSFAFIDFSETYAGTPAADVAMYLVHLDVALQPFFSRPVVARAQRLFTETYYGRSPARLDRRVIRSLLAYEMRTAALFLRFTSDHHRQPSPPVAWMIRRFVHIIARGTTELRGDRPQLILAA